MICYVLAMGKQHVGPHVVVGYSVKISWPGFLITSPDHLAESSPPHCQSPSTICRPFGLEKVKTMAEELTYNYSGVIKMSGNTNIFAGKFVFSLRFCRSAVCVQRI